MAESGLDLRAMEAEIAQYVAAGGRWLLVVERVPELLEHVRALRAALEPFVAMGRIEGKFLTARPDGNTAVIVVNLGDLRRAAAVLRGAQDPEGP